MNKRKESIRQRQAEQVVEETLGNQPAPAMKRIELIVLKLARDEKQLKGKVQAKLGTNQTSDRSDKNNSKSIRPQNQ